MYPAQRRTKNANPPPPGNPPPSYYPDYSIDPNYPPQGMNPPDYGNYYSQPPMQGIPQQSQPPPPSQWQHQQHVPPQGPQSNYPPDMSARGFGMPQSSPGMQPFLNAMAMQYGQTVAGQGKEIMQEKMKKYSTFFTTLKYYFAVDTTYVAKKLGLLFFPFTHKDWAVHFNENEPIAPRYEINAPDLYIPCMAFVTYVLTAGYLLGLKNQFSPEQLGKQASSAFGWVSLEILLVLLTHYLFSIASSSLKWLDMVAFCSYKFVCIVSMLLGSLALGNIGYTVVLAYSTFSLGFFLMRTMRIAMLKESEGSHGGNKRTLYLVFFVCVCQPLMMYWLTYHLVNIKSEE